MDLIWWILLGLVAGGLARLIMGAREPSGCVVTILLGIAGALLAGHVGKAAGWYEQGEAAGFIAATVGAVVILAVYGALRRKT